jgi:hypothetical protein
MVSKAFVLAGAAVFTVSRDGGKHYTYRVEHVTPEAGSKFTAPAWFAYVLAGPNNTTDFRYMGLVNPQTLRVKLTAKSKIGPHAEALTVLNWALRCVRQQATYTPPPAYRIEHAGKCGRCGRTLTTPDSIKRGIGPECWSMLGMNPVAVA